MIEISNLGLWEGADQFDTLQNKTNAALTRQNGWSSANMEGANIWVRLLSVSTTEIIGDASILFSVHVRQGPIAGKTGVSTFRLTVKRQFDDRTVSIEKMSGNLGAHALQVLENSTNVFTLWFKKPSTYSGTVTVHTRVHDIFSSNVTTNSFPGATPASAPPAPVMGSDPIYADFYISKVKVDIGTWNLQADGLKTIPAAGVLTTIEQETDLSADPSLASSRRLAGMSAYIFCDTVPGSTTSHSSPLTSANPSTGIPDGSVRRRLDFGYALNRTAGGLFDNANFSSTAVNRGFLLLEVIEGGNV